MSQVETSYELNPTIVVSVPLPCDARAIEDARGQMQTFLNAVYGNAHPKSTYDDRYRVTADEERIYFTASLDRKLPHNVRKMFPNIPHAMFDWEDENN